MGKTAGALLFSWLMLAASTISFILTCGDVDFGSDGDDDANNDNSEEEIPVKGRHPL